MCMNNSGRERSESRVPNGMGPIEIALRNGLYRKTRIISLSHWWGLLLIRRRKHTSTATYTHGRSVLGLRRIQKSKATNRKTGFQTMRDLRCLCSGSASGCEYNSKRTWFVEVRWWWVGTQKDMIRISSHVSEHNHPLSETSGEKKEWYSHARLDTCAKDMIKYLRDNDSLQRCMTNMIQTWMLRRWRGSVAASAAYWGTVQTSARINLSIWVLISQISSFVNVTDSTEF